MSVRQRCGWLNNVFSHYSTPSYSLIQASSTGRYRTESTNFHDVITLKAQSPTKCAKSLREMSYGCLSRSQGVPSYACIECFSRVYSYRTELGYDNGYPFEPERFCLMEQAPQPKSYLKILGSDVYSWLHTHNSPWDGMS